MITQTQLKELLHYDPLTGLFTWLVGRGGCKAGSIAGTLGNRGYIIVKVCKIDYTASRLAWLYMTGSWPNGEVDHEDLCKSNNIWTNLREATHSQNGHNTTIRKHNKSGFKGVVYHAPYKKWAAKINVGGKRKHLGYYVTPQEAHAAYCAAATAEHGQFARTS